MIYVYPAILYPDDGKIGVTVPDLKGCHTFGEDTADALIMAKDAVEMWLWDAENNMEPIPPASKTLTVKENEILTLILADTDEWRRAHDNRAVKKTLTIPSWLNVKAETANINFSQLLQQALKNALEIT